MTIDMQNCPICRGVFPRGEGSGFYENLTPDQIGWETCRKKACIAKVRTRNIKNHKKWFPEEHEG